MFTNTINMIIRGRFCRRVIILILIFLASFYGTVLFYGDLKIPRVMRLTDLRRCPACYGVTVCPELYSNQIIPDKNDWTNMLFNAKNIYYGYTKSNRRIVLKKLAHDWEFSEFDNKLCKAWKLNKNCHPIDLLNVTGVEKKLEQLVHFNLTVPQVEPRKGLVFCPYSFGIHDFIEPALNNKKTSRNYQSDMINIWTMLSINPEPIVLQVIPKSKGWQVPAYGGVCGRLEIVAYEGQPLSVLGNIHWHRKLIIAKRLLDAAMDFTYKHDRFRFYLMDWSTDNIVVNEKDEITFVDLEDVIVLDKHISPKSDLPDWYKRYFRDDNDPANVFSIENMCKHHLSDHNIYAACHTLGGDNEPFLHPVPVDFQHWAQLSTLLRDCLKGTDRFKTVVLLQRYIAELLTKGSVVGIGSVR
ncbi:divergent protein kinase domain 2A-like [Pectinophora gossypiella]|uniref:divergent protein kinase domain 2A-like n=1 Tax=Pectinophora gossypiella TaxID=13191 RepID=UPI00214F50DF|nr:divergent protein kinase domain 2A-like [Pectinophora gossypiella]